MGQLAQALVPLARAVTFASLVFDPSEADGCRDSSSRSAATRPPASGAGLVYLVLPWTSGDIMGSVARWLTSSALDTWSGRSGRQLHDAAAAADLIIVQSEPAAVLIGRLRRSAPRAKIVCYADNPCGAAESRLRSLLNREPALVDQVIVTARATVPHFRALGHHVRFVPAGLDIHDGGVPRPTSFVRSVNVVAPADEPFDGSVIQVAAQSLADGDLHLIDPPSRQSAESNVREYPGRSPAEIAAMIRHADLVIAPYAETAGAEHLADTSKALMIAGHFGVPAVCPTFAAGDHPLRFGYEPGRSASIRDALARARRVKAGAEKSCPAVRWSEIARLVATPLRQAAPTTVGRARRVERAHGG